MSVYEKMKKLYMPVFCAAIFGAAFVLSGCETSTTGSKRPTAPLDSAIFKGKKESRR